MGDYIIISDSTCDLSQQMADELGVPIQPMTFTINHKEYKNYLDERELSLVDFYNFIKEGQMGTTTQLNMVDIINFFTPYLEKGLDILCIAFSSGLSGSCNAIRMAKDELLEQYPNRKILVVDSLCASAGEGLLIYQAVNNKNAGMDIESNANALDKFKYKIRHWFTVDQLDTLRKGGRLSGTAAFAAKLLNIKPVLNVDDDGHLKAVYKKVGRKMAIRQLVESTISGYDKTQEYITIISHADCEEEANKLKALLETAYKENNITSKIIITKIGPVIGSHAGPGTLALFTIGDKR